MSEPKTVEQAMLLRMAQDNAQIAADAIKTGMTDMARAHLRQALHELDLAEVNNEATKEGRLIEV